MLRKLAAVLVLGLAFAGTAAAQPQPPGGGTGVGGNRPTFSPYLNLVAGGRGSPAINYLGIVRPQLQAQQAFGQLQQQANANAAGVQALNNGLAIGADPNSLQTGVVARFNNTNPFFSRNPITGTGGSLGGGFRPTQFATTGVGGIGGSRAGTAPTAGRTGATGVGSRR